MKKWENFSKEELEQFVKDSTSYAQVCEKIGYKGGSGQKAVKDMIELYQFNISQDLGCLILLVILYVNTKMKNYT